MIRGPASCDRCDHDGDFFYGVTHVHVDATRSGSTGAVGVHWALSQGTYLRSLYLSMADGRAGIFGENGSGGLITDVAIEGGTHGMEFGNQQWTFRNISITGAKKAGIFIYWNWVFSFMHLKISNCPIGITWPKGAASLILLDSEFSNVTVGIAEAVPGNGFFLLDRVSTSNVSVMIAGSPAPPDPSPPPPPPTPPPPPAPASTCPKFGHFNVNFDLDGTNGPGKPAKTAEGCCALCLADAGCNGVTFFAGVCYLKHHATKFVANQGRISALLSNTTTSAATGVSTWAPASPAATDSLSVPAKPFFVSWRQGPALQAGEVLPGTQGELPSSGRPDTPLPSRQRPFPGQRDGSQPGNVMDYGAKADGRTDDSAALQKAINSHAEVFLPHGTYLIAHAVTLTKDSALFGEAYSVLMASASNSAWANNVSGPDSPPAGSMLSAPPGATVQLVDLTFMVDGPVPGCLLIDWQAAPQSGMFDVMFRIEHPVWGQLRISESQTPAGGYFENMWLWVADHIFDTGQGINVTSPRGFYFDHSTGPTYLYGVAAEHSSEYQYFLDSTTDVTMVLTQSETPYWQDPPTALAMKISNSTKIRSYGAAYECWFHGIEKALLEVDSSEAYLYLPNQRNASLLLTGDHKIKASDPQYNVTGHFTQSFVADIP